MGAHAERGEEPLRVDEGHALAIVGPAVPDDERRLLDAFVTELAGSIHIEELEAEASEADDLERVNDLQARHPFGRFARPPHAPRRYQGVCDVAAR